MKWVWISLQPIEPRETLQDLKTSGLGEKLSTIKCHSPMLLVKPNWFLLKRSFKSSESFQQVLKISNSGNFYGTKVFLQKNKIFSFTCCRSFGSFRVRPLTYLKTYSQQSHLEKQCYHFLSGMQCSFHFLLEPAFGTSWKWNLNSVEVDGCGLTQISEHLIFLYLPYTFGFFD